MNNFIKSAQLIVDINFRNIGVVAYEAKYDYVAERVGMA